MRDIDNRVVLCIFTSALEENLKQKNVTLKEKHHNDKSKIRPSRLLSSA